VSRHKNKPSHHLDVLGEIEQRTAMMLQWTEQNLLRTSLLDFALTHLTVGRVTLYQAVLEAGTGRPAGQCDASEAGGMAALTLAGRELTAAVDSLRAAGTTHNIPRGLLTRAWLRFVEGDPTGARADLDEAWQIAGRGAMKLHLADIHLHCARLFRDRAALAQARQLIEQCGY
jgi:hypothetical protein